MKHIRTLLVIFLAASSHMGFAETLVADMGFINSGFSVFGNALLLIEPADPFPDAELSATLEEEQVLVDFALPMTCVQNISQSVLCTSEDMQYDSVTWGKQYCSKAEAVYDTFPDPTQGVDTTCDYPNPPTPPGSVSSTFTVCQWGWAKHRVWWSMTNLAIWWEMWVQQPDVTVPYVYNNTVYSGNDINTVSNGEARVKIKACTSFYGCSAKSTDYAPLIYPCSLN